MIKKKRVLNALICLFTAVVFFLPFSVKMQNGGGMVEANASQYAFDEIAVQRYDVNMQVRTDRKIEVNERITVQFLDDDLTMFYRSLPTDGARYENIVASCEGNDEFYYYVADNEDVGGFIDVNCVGNADFQKTWTYEISYVMEQDSNAIENGMLIDVVGFGWQVPLNDVRVQVDFPEKPLSYKVYKDVFGVDYGVKVDETWETDTRLILTADCLDVVYSELYEEYNAAGITLEFTLAEGALVGYHATRFFTADIGKVFLGGGIAAVLSILVAVLLKKKKELVTVVNLRAPDDMDPMKMGKWIDGAVNNEDVTSMIYYFANKGYLKIDLTDQDNPTLITKYEQLPDTATIYERTLFNGLFQGASAWQGGGFKEETIPMPKRCVKVSELTGEFYQTAQTAIKQVPDAPPMYEAKSIFTFISGSIFGFLLGVFIPLLISMRIGGGYFSFAGSAFFVPLGISAFLRYYCDKNKYKWRKGRQIGISLIPIGIALLFSLIFIFAIAKHVMTGYEKIFLCLFVFTASALTSGALTRTDEYLKVLENILGFKEFIVVTEEDKIKVMLETNPELYYKVLPYAQVLGVTDEWEGKFKKLMIASPSWCVSSDLTLLDYYLINRCITRSMTASMVRLASESMAKGAGSVIGRSGGGGHFGGFGGGGFGGGGGGAR